MSTPYSEQPPYQHLPDAAEIGNRFAPPRRPPPLPARRSHQAPLYSDLEEDSARDLYRWFWPIGSWITLILNVIVMFVVLGDMWRNGYDFIAHIASIMVLSGSFVFLAVVYRWILPNFPDEPEVQEPAQPSD